MEYTRTFNELKGIFSSENKKMSIAGSDVQIHNIEFRSDPLSKEFSNKNDSSITENRTFSYPVFSPPERTSKKVILFTART